MTKRFIIVTEDYTIHMTDDEVLAKKCCEWAQVHDTQMPIIGARDSNPDVGSTEYLPVREPGQDWYL